MSPSQRYGNRVTASTSNPALRKTSLDRLVTCSSHVFPFIFTCSLGRCHLPPKNKYTQNVLLFGSERKCMKSYIRMYEASCTDSQLTDFHIRLEGKHCSQDESPCVGNQRSPDVPQEMQRVVTAIQQVQTADHIILETSLLPLIYTQHSEHDSKTGFSDANKLLLKGARNLPVFPQRCPISTTSCHTHHWVSLFKQKCCVHSLIPVTFIMLFFDHC